MHVTYQSNRLISTLTSYDVRGRPLTGFEQVLLGVVAGRPQSGYELKKFFSNTPAMVYEPSPGALYPALRRLEQGGLLRSRLAVSSGRRERRIYRVTGRGLAAHRAWITEPVADETVARDLGLHLMRFVMMEPHVARADVLRFLRALAQGLERFVASIEAFVETSPLNGDHPALALQHGIAVHRASLAWARSVIDSLGEEVPELDGNGSGGSDSKSVL